MSPIARANEIVAFLCVSVRYGTSFGKYLFVNGVTGSHERVSPAKIQVRYIIDQIAKVIPAGVTDVGNIFEISACVIPPIKYGEPGILKSAVINIERIATIRRIYFI